MAVRDGTVPGTSFIPNRDGLGLGLGTVALALIVFGLGLECSGLVKITALITFILT